MKKIFITSLLAMISLALQAQPNEVKLTYSQQADKSGVKEYAKSVGMFVARPEVKTVKGRSTAVWHMTNMDWIKDYCEAKGVTIEKAADGGEQRDGAALLLPHACRRSDQPVADLRGDESR